MAAVRFPRHLFVLGAVVFALSGALAAGPPVKQFQWMGGIGEGQFVAEDSGSVPINMWAGRFSIVARIKTPMKGRESDWQVFFNRSSRDQVCKGVLFGLRDMELRFGRQCNPSPATGVKLEPGASYHVGVTYDGGIAHIYVNGLKRKSISLITEFTNPGAFVVGAGRSTGGERFLGKVCEVELYHPGIGPEKMADLHKEASKDLCGENSPWTLERITGPQPQEVEITCKSSRENSIQQGSAKWTQVGDLRSTIEANTDGVLISTVLGRVTGPERPGDVLRASHFLDEQLMTAPQADYRDFLMHGNTPRGKWAPFSFVQMKGVLARMHTTSVMADPKGDGWVVRDAVLQSATLSCDAISEMNSGEPIVTMEKDWAQIANLKATLTAKTKGVMILTANAHIRPAQRRDDGSAYLSFYANGDQVVTKHNYGLFHTYGEVGQQNFQPVSFMQMKAVEAAGDVDVSLHMVHTGKVKQWEVAEANFQAAIIPHAKMHERYPQNWANPILNTKDQWAQFLGNDFTTVVTTEAPETLVIMTFNGHTRPTSGGDKATLEASFQVGKNRIQCEAPSTYHISGAVPGRFWAPMTFVQVAKVPQGKHEIKLMLKTNEGDWSINGAAWQIAVVESTELSRAKRHYGTPGKVPEGRAPPGYAGKAEYHLFLKQLEQLREDLKKVEMDQNLSTEQRSIQMERIKAKILEKEVAISRNEAPDKIEDSGVSETTDDRGLRIETGSLWPKSSTIVKGIYTPWALENAYLGDDPEGKYDYREKVTFKKPFLSTPVVTAAVRGFAILPSTAKRMNVWVTNTTKTDFTVVMEGWGGTRIHEALVNWVAIGQDPDLLKRAEALTTQIERETRIYEDHSAKFEKSKAEVQKIEADSRKMYTDIRAHLEKVVEYHKEVEKYLNMHGDRGMQEIRKQWKETKDFEHTMMDKMRAAMDAADKLMKEIKKDIEMGHQERERIAEQAKQLEKSLESNFKHYESEVDEINRFLNTDPDSIHNQLKAKVEKFLAGNKLSENAGVLKYGFDIMESPAVLKEKGTPVIRKVTPALLEEDEEATLDDDEELLEVGEEAATPASNSHVPCRCYSKSENMGLERGLEMIGMPSLGDSDKACYCDSKVAGLGKDGEEFEFTL